jgi:hypothetical protein
LKFPGFGIASIIYHLYVVRLERRDRVLKAFELEAYSSLGDRPGSFAVAEDWARRCLSLPIYPELTHPCLGMDLSRAHPLGDDGPQVQPRCDTRRLHP